jgi:hypothetical protein
MEALFPQSSPKQLKQITIRSERIIGNQPSLPYLSTFDPLIGNGESKLQGVRIQVK